VGYTFHTIKVALDSEDVEGLLAMGCPPDEYDSEASLIEGRIAKVPGDKLNADRIADIVAEVWNSQFGPFDEEDLDKRRQAFSSVARRILT
jgi:hypothetical protein